MNSAWVAIGVSLAVSLFTVAMAAGRFTEAIKNISELLKRLIDRQDAHEVENTKCATNRAVMESEITAIRKDVDGMIERERERHPHGTGSHPAGS